MAISGSSGVKFFFNADTEKWLPIEHHEIPARAILATLLIHFVMRSIFKIRRRTKQIFIVNSWALGGGWKADATFIDLILFGIRIKNLHKYYITYRGEYSDLRGTKYYANKG